MDRGPWLERDPLVCSRNAEADLDDIACHPSSCGATTHLAATSSLALEGGHYR
jgi:hypothetical protein